MCHLVATQCFTLLLTFSLVKQSLRLPMASQGLVGLSDGRGDFQSLWFSLILYVSMFHCIATSHLEAHLADGPGLSAGGSMVQALKALGIKEAFESKQGFLKMSDALTTGQPMGEIEVRYDKYIQIPHKHSSTFFCFRFVLRSCRHSNFGHQIPESNLKTKTCLLNPGVTQDHHNCCK